MQLPGELACQRWNPILLNSQGTVVLAFDDIRHVIMSFQVEYDHHIKPPTPYAPPDPMGIGCDEDTIGNVQQLVPKQPHADKSKLELCAPVSLGECFKSHISLLSVI